jgi:hypothetical protein
VTWLPRFVNPCPKTCLSASIRNVLGNNLPLHVSMIIYYRKAQCRVENLGSLNTVRIIMRIWENELNQTGIYVGFIHSTTNFVLRVLRKMREPRQTLGDWVRERGWRGTDRQSEDIQLSEAYEALFIGLHRNCLSHPFGMPLHEDNNVSERNETHVGGGDVVWDLEWISYCWRVVMIYTTDYLTSE